MHTYTVIFNFSGTDARIVQMDQEGLNELISAIKIKGFQGVFRLENKREGTPSGNEFINLEKVSTVRWEFKK